MGALFYRTPAMAVHDATAKLLGNLPSNDGKAVNGKAPAYSSNAASQDAATANYTPVKKETNKLKKVKVKKAKPETNKAANLKPKKGKKVSVPSCLLHHYFLKFFLRRCFRIESLGVR